jgi:hypothetical protein
VLAALIALRKVGVFAGALIKKRQFWPRYIAGNAIDIHMAHKEVGDVAAVQWHLETQSTMFGA